AMAASHLAPLNPDPSTFVYDGSGRAHRGHRRSVRRGRIMVLMIFAGIIAINGAGVAVGSATPSFSSYMLYAPILAAVSVMWSAVFLAGVWYRQSWARYVLFGLECITIGVSLLLFTESFEPGADKAEQPALLCVGALFVLMHLGIAWLLMCS